MPNKDIEKRMDSLEGKIDKIMTNELPHIQQSVTKIDTNVEWILWVTKLVFGGILVGVTSAILKVIFL